MTAGQGLHEALELALGTVPDPCMDMAGMPTSIVELGLVRGMTVSHDGDVEVMITFTEPGCGYTHAVLSMVHERLEDVPGVRSVRTIPAWSPTWSPEDLLTPARSALAQAKARLGGLPVPDPGSATDLEGRARPRQR